jgi:hypothetical protein
MPDYAKMYALLCGAASEAIDLIESNNPAGAAALLRRALLEAEEFYVGADEDLP